MATYDEAIMALLRAGLTNRDILDLHRDDGQEAILKLGEERLAEEAAEKEETECEST